jgi:hypothetical protein
MGRKSTYLVIIGTHVDEALAIARIVRSRARRKLAEIVLIQGRRRRLVHRTLLEQQRRVGDLLERLNIRRSR